MLCQQALVPVQVPANFDFFVILDPLCNLYTIQNHIVWWLETKFCAELTIIHNSDHSSIIILRRFACASLFYLFCPAQVVFSVIKLALQICQQLANLSTSSLSTFQQPVVRQSRTWGLSHLVIIFSWWISASGVLPWLKSGPPSCYSSELSNLHLLEKHSTVTLRVLQQWICWTLNSCNAAHFLWVETDKENWTKQVLTQQQWIKLLNHTKVYQYTFLSVGSNG